MRIASLLPSATEIAFALGVGPEVVAVSHECDFPPAARGLPTVTASAIETVALTPAQIDAAMADLLRRGASTYTIDRPLLRRLRPDLILTQALCDVCAVAEGQVHRAVHEEELGARVLTLTPRTLAELLASIEEVGDAVVRSREAHEVTASLRGRLAVLRRRAPAGRPRVLMLEWTDPPFAAGHWVPDQVDAAGGVDVLGRAGEPSFRTTWEAIAAAEPDVAVILPCGYGLDGVVAQARDLWDVPAWRALPAVARDAVWAVDASSWFSRPGPRVLDGVEALAAILADPAAHAGPPGTAKVAAPTTAASG